MIAARRLQLVHTPRGEIVAHLGGRAKGRVEGRVEGLNEVWGDVGEG